jgi:hypothetical protein
MHGYAELICIHSLQRNWRSGYGSRMMAHWESVMGALKFKYVMLSTQEDETAKYFYEKCECEPQSSALLAAEQQFVKAFRDFPFHVHVAYLGPQNAGPSTLLYPTPTSYRATMTCFAYDDLEAWRSIYPAEVFEQQFAKLCEGWEQGLRLLPDGDESETAVMAWACYCLFKSSLNQIRFVRARDGGRRADMLKIAADELKIAEKMLALMNKNAAIGYEAANHYYFSKGQIVEKIINCRYIINNYQ